MATFPSGGPTMSVLLLLCCFAFNSQAQQSISRVGKVTSGASSPNVIELTDDNFEELVGDEVWMVEIFAPWCSHCRQLEPAWNLLAEETKEMGIKIAKVDGSRQKVLMSRFGVVAFPSIFLLREGKTWSYLGPRNTQAMKDFALSGYLKEDALPFYKAPNSVAGRALGKLHSIPGLIRQAYTHLKTERGLSDLTIVLGGLAIPVLLGAIAICVVDAMYVRRARSGGDYFEHEHQE